MAAVNGDVIGSRLPNFRLGTTEIKTCDYRCHFTARALPWLLVPDDNMSPTPADPNPLSPDGDPEPLARLPAVYAEALRLARAGLDPRTIAERLGVPTESLPTLFTLAEAKLARAMRSADSHEETGEP